MRLKMFLNEASFNIKVSDKVLKLITDLIAKKLGEKFYKFGNDFMEEFTSNDGRKGFGARYLTDSGKMFRFNWLKDENSSMTFSSVDIWNSFKTLEKPDKTVNLPEDLNIVQSLDKIIKAFKLSSGSIDLDESYIYENEEVKRGRGRPRKIVVNNGSKEESTLTKQIKTDQKTLDSQKYADVETIFQDIEDLTNMVAVGGQPSLLITGMAGIGKTYIVTNTLSKNIGAEEDKWCSVKGKASTLGLYSNLFLNRDKLIVFDDCDSVFSNPDAINILKGALDSYEKRTISWLSPMTVNVSKMSADDRNEFYDDLDTKLATDPSNPKIKYPSQFDFNGKIIFISNLPASKIDSAIKSRSMTIDVMLKREDVIKRIESILPVIAGDAPLNEKKEVLFFLEKGLKEGTIKEINMRSFILALRIKTSGSSRWEHLVKNYV